MFFYVFGSLQGGKEDPRDLLGFATRAANNSKTVAAQNFWHLLNKVDLASVVHCRSCVHEDLEQHVLRLRNNPKERRNAYFFKESCN